MYHVYDAACILPFKTPKLIHKATKSPHSPAINRFLQASDDLIVRSNEIRCRLHHQFYQMRANLLNYPNQPQWLWY